MNFSDQNEELNNALKINLYGAVHTALLLLPEAFSEQQLFKTIANISYSGIYALNNLLSYYASRCFLLKGDFRKHVGEDRNKVSNIVIAQMEQFRRLYSPILQDMRDYVIVDHARGMGLQDVSYTSKFYHLMMLPKMLQVSWRSTLGQI